MSASREVDLRHMRHAARLGLRGHGGAEPNPLVGCVIVSPRDEVVGWGYHRRCGEAHAEAIALERAGARAEGATVYVTLEPCNHEGKTGPCASALIRARVARVVIARRDPNPLAAGGIEALQQAGIRVELLDGCREAFELSEPFAYRLRTGLPWVIAKWAQTMDGSMTTSVHGERWISGPRSRALVHRERGRVDAILTGIGTVLADDPLLTARCRTPRRVARRVVVDRNLRAPVDSQLVATACEVPTVIVCAESLLSKVPDRARALRDRGVELIGLEGDASLPLRETLRQLLLRYQVSTVLTECGPTLLSRLIEERLINEAWVFTSPALGGTGPRVLFNQGTTFSLMSVHDRENDVFARYRVEGARP